MRTVEVAVPLPLANTFTYLLPDEIDTPPDGVRVRVAFGGRKLVGFVVSSAEVEDPGKLKAIDRVLDVAPLVSGELLELARRMARHWFCGVGEALSSFLPAGVKKGARGKRIALVRATPEVAAAALEEWKDSNRTARQKELLRTLLSSPEERERGDLLREIGCSESPLETLRKKGLVELRWEHRRDDVFADLDISPGAIPELTADQVRAVETIGAAIDSDRHRSILVQGVTGSGKTEVYLRAIKKTLALGRGAIVLVPEISLTPQTLERFESRFGAVAVLHSHLTDAERAHQWDEIAAGRRRIAIGPRSAVFAPVRDLGLIVLDEEHESTFKQQNVPRYHARDVALMRGAIENAVVVFGSATPSLEIDEAARRGTVTRVEMPKRVSGRPLPAVTLIDMRSQRPVGPGGIFSPILSNLVARTLDQGEQVLLFLNRRGYHTSVLCRRCGWKLHCTACDIPMTFYKERDTLLCHYCNRSVTPPRKCADCGNPGVMFSGFGTETVEHAVRTLFPRARVARMDGETMRKRGAHTELHGALKRREVDVLIGTQMAAKGLDFPGITLIGVVSGDTSLMVPDFRAAERTFQLMTQVSGRAGRGAVPGRVIIQTYIPDHYSHQCAKEHDFDTFAATELAYRRSAHYPPFGVLARIVVQSAQEEAAIGKLDKIHAALQAPATARGVTLLGPSPAPIGFIKKQFRHHLVLRADDGDAILSCLDAARASFRGDRKVQVMVDRDPTSMA